MRRGQAPLALLVVAVVAAAAFGADRIGAAAPGPAPEPTATSSIWVCPHGGAEGWGGRVVVANPGDRPVEVRISSIGRRRPDPPVTRTVEPGRQLVEEVRADEPGRATVVEAFGGWVGAWWLVTAEDPGSLGAEPCAPGASSAWWAADPGTPQGEDAFLVVTNPTASDAVVDVALFTADRPPIRDAEWTDLELPARRSVALPLNRKAEGEDALLAEVLAEVGKVVVGSYVVGSDGGIRSVLATPSLGTARFLPVGGGADQATLTVGAPAEGDVGFGATLLGGDQAQPAGGLADAEQAGAAAHAYAIPTAGPSSVELDVRDGVDVAAALRSVGRSPDDGGTGGAPAPATAWIVPSTLLGAPAFPSLLLANVGDADARVTLRHLPGGDVAPDEATIDVRAGTVAEVPRAFLEVAPEAAIEVTSEDGRLVALGATASTGTQGYARYALVLGIPIPLDA